MPHTCSQGSPQLTNSKIPTHFPFTTIPLPTFDMADANIRRTVHSRATEGYTGIRSPITRPTIADANNWQIPSHVLTIIINVTQFHGLDEEDAHGHLSRFVRICDTFNLSHITKEANYLRLFPFTLSSRAATWYDTMPNSSITTWEDMLGNFLRKYHPASKDSRIREQIHSFRMDPDDPYYMAWERFQTLLSRCPHHGLSDWALVEKFYNGLTFETRFRFNTPAQGNFMEKNGY